MDISSAPQLRRITQEELDSMISDRERREQANHAAFNERLDLDHTDLRGLDLTRGRIQYANMRGADLSDLDLHAINILSNDLSGAILKNTDLSEAIVGGVNFSNCTLIGTNFEKTSQLDSANFSGAYIEDLKIPLAQLKHLRGWLLCSYSADMREKLGLPEDHDERVSRRDFSNYNLDDASLYGADFSEFSFESASFRRSSMIAKCHRAIFSKANLESAELRGCDFSGANLKECSLKGAHLEGLRFDPSYDYHISPANLINTVLSKADLRGASLKEVDFENADLSQAQCQGANFSRANLLHARLDDANLQDTDFTDAKGMIGGQLSGTNVSGAKLPEALQGFEELVNVEAISQNAGKLFVSMLLACAYSLLTIVSTTDKNLVLNTSSSKLPIIDTEIPILWFYCVGPSVLLGIYLYFHLYLAKMWQGFSQLPAIFPDGRPLHRRSHPWLINDLVRSQFLHLKNQRDSLAKIQDFASVTLAWFIVPVMIILFWGHYLRRHHWPGTAIHLFLIVSSLCLGLMFYRLMKSAFNRSQANVRPSPAAWRYDTLAFVVVALLSDAGINAVPPKYAERSVAPFLTPTTYVSRRIIPQFFQAVQFNTSANWKGLDISTRPANWSGKVEDVKGITLSGYDLRRLNAEDAFFVSADLSGANLMFASLDRANMKSANLSSANLAAASLEETDLENASLGTNFSFASGDHANLKGTKGYQSDFFNSQFPNAIFDNAQIPNSTFQNAELIAASFRNSSFSQADFQGADLSEASLSNADFHEAQFSRAIFKKSDLTSANLKDANLAGASLIEANLINTDCSGADFTGADFSEANLKGSILAGADLRMCKGLTEQQINSAVVNQKTRLPQGLTKS